MKDSTIIAIFEGRKGELETMGFKQKDEVLDAIIDAENQLKELISQTAYQKYRQLFNLILDSNYTEVKFYFKEGFKLGFDLANELNE